MPTAGCRGLTEPLAETAAGLSASYHPRHSHRHSAFVVAVFHSHAIEYDAPHGPKYSLQLALARRLLDSR